MTEDIIARYGTAHVSAGVPQLRPTAGLRAFLDADPNPRAVWTGIAYAVAGEVQGPHARPMPFVLPTPIHGHRHWLTVTAGPAGAMLVEAKREDRRSRIRPLRRGPTP